jgi:hypothetical protein
VTYCARAGGCYGQKQYRQKGNHDFGLFKCIADQSEATNEKTGEEVWHRLWEALARGKRRMWNRAGDIERGQEKKLSAVGDTGYSSPQNLNTVTSSSVIIS